GSELGGSSIPVDSLNLGLNSCAAQDQSNPFCSIGNANGIGTTDPDTAYYNGPVGMYSAGVPFTANTLQGDTGWGSGGGYGAVSFSGTSLTPEPATFGLIGFGLLGLGIVSRKRNRKV
ncbi:MAG TPA: PEP-CTERM sorting domain-containing protein, partial [Bryobacteraceae bacterium]|nr:PEP-CTERM sorting domain-containing protein [Bryobacteraceae bacterium]